MLFAQRTSPFIPFLKHANSSSYEDAMTTAMANYSEHPIHPISELEVFTGQIFNNSGVQTHRQRERSIKLKDEFERIASWILSQMRPDYPLTGYVSEYDSLLRCLACFHIAAQGEDKDSRSGNKRRGWEGLQSFRVVAACALLVEIELKERNREFEKHLEENQPSAVPFPGKAAERALWDPYEGLTPELYEYERRQALQEINRQLQNSIF